MVWVLAVVGTILGVVMAALMLPVRLSGHAAAGTEGGTNAYVRVMPFAGAAGLGVVYSDGVLTAECRVGSLRLFAVSLDRLERLFGGKKEKKKKAPDKEKAPAIGLRERMRSGVAQLTKGRAMAGGIVRDVRSCIRVDRCDAVLRLGLFGSPRLLGSVIGALYALIAFLPAPCSIEPEWDFTCDVVRGDVTLMITIRTYRIWPIAVRRVWAMKMDRQLQFTGERIMPQEV